VLTNRGGGNLRRRDYRTAARPNDVAIGTIRRVYSKVSKRGRVISQSPRSGTLLQTCGKVNLVVSRGRRH